MTESEFNQVLEKHGMSLVRPVHPCGQGWGQVNMPDGSVRDRWRGGKSLEEQAAYLANEAKALATPPQAKKPRPAAATADFSGESLRAAVGKALQASSSAAQGDNAPKKAAKVAAKKATKKVVKKAVKKVAKKGAQK